MTESLLILLISVALFCGFGLGVMFTLAHVISRVARSAPSLVQQASAAVSASAVAREFAADSARLQAAGGQSPASPGNKPGLPPALEAAYRATSERPGAANDAAYNARQDAPGAAVGLKAAVRADCRPCRALRRLLGLRGS